MTARGFLRAQQVHLTPTTARRAGACGRKASGYQWRSRRISSRPPLALSVRFCVRFHGSLHPWWRGVNAIVCQQAFRDADTAFSSWKSAARRGVQVGYPRPKWYGRCRDSFRMFSVRLHRPARRLARLLARGGEVKSVTIAREGRAWFASFTVRIPAAEPVRASRRQRSAGTVGVDLGVTVFAATSSPLVIGDDKVQLFENPRHLDNARRLLHKWQRRMARRHVKGLPARRQSAGRRQARDEVARLHALVAARRASTQHLLTKRLVTQFAHVALEDLQVKNMTRSARGTVQEPGRNVMAKAGLNRSMLDVGFAEIRRQIEYKAPWYGARVSAVNPAYTSQTCSQCGHVDAKSRRTRDLFTCTRCGHHTHADIGAALNIKHRALTAQEELPDEPDRGQRPGTDRKRVEGWVTVLPAALICPIPASR
ncbi:hypothetical protein CG723_45330 [Streptomyces sp. CB01635]|uniref:RNA-guided endonuclease InsQ/TnpB family protein n=1 Tax=unclassified Streptomyces TaxID=2593676 RepID=UPI000C273FE4|nr:RNA-guided endonuclease TnpB family protein [Streptomyces sp. CB01635]PJN05358.1 hypothetical protein CG723_45330 [Streptomyces sp. CB01635]